VRDENIHVRKTVPRAKFLAGKLRPNRIHACSEEDMAREIMNKSIQEEG